MRIATLIAAAVAGQGKCPVTAMYLPAGGHEICPADLLFVPTRLPGQAQTALWVRAGSPAAMCGGLPLL
jgi:hypothetical protein